MSGPGASPPDGTVRDWLDRRAEAGGEAFVFPEGETPLSWPVLRDEARRVAAALTARGAEKGESVALMHPNGRAGVIALYGTLYGGFRATMINLVAGSEAICYALHHSEARFAFVHEAGRAFLEACEAAPTQLDLDDDAEAPLHDVAPGDDALLMYTSGTTGRPKGVTHSQSSLLAGGWTTALAHRLTAEDRGLCVLPIYHINGLCVTVMGALVSGGALVMAPRFSARRFWAQAAEGRATWASVVPTIISHLLAGDLDPDAETRERLRFVRSASAPLSPEVQTAFEARFGAPIVETMGLTETAAQILSNPLPPGVRKLGSPGVAQGCEVAVMDRTGASCPPDAEGEIAVRGPNVMRGYLKNPEETAKTIRPDGWLMTGDLGRIDADGYVFVTGRLKELIIKGGENIAPREVDEALYASAEVVEAAAFARPCASYGERVEAAVKLRDGSGLSEDELKALCVTRLGKFKSPDRVFILDDLPKGPSGKIQRRKLAEITG